MKKLIVFLLIITPFVSFSQKKPKIKGSRTVTEVREDLPAFNAIELNDDLSIQFKKSSSEGYEVKADDNLIDILKFEVEDSTLVVSCFYNVIAKKKLEITVNYKEISTITQRNGKIKFIDILSTDNLDVNTYGSCTLELKATGFVANLNMENSSKGDFNLDIDSLNVSLKNKSDAKIYSVSSAKNVELLDTSSLNIEGSTDTLNLKMYGNTKFTGQKLGARSAKVQVEKSASARINALRDIELKSRGNAKTFLYGDPKIAILEFLDASQLIKKKS